MRLARLLEMCHGRRGIGHQVAIERLRSWLRETPEKVIIDQMQQIRNVDLLKHMQEAGLRKRLHTAYMEHLATLG